MSSLVEEKEISLQASSVWLPNNLQGGENENYYRWDKSLRKETKKLHKKIILPTRTKHLAVGVRKMPVVKGAVVRGKGEEGCGNIEY